jgi:hypothetical protein
MSHCSLIMPCYLIPGDQLRVCLKASLSIFLPPRSSCCAMLLSLVLLPNALPSPLGMWSWCSADKQWCVSCSIAMKSSGRDPQTCWILVFSWLRYDAASCQSSYQSSRASMVSLLSHYFWDSVENVGSPAL